ncbi:hypothetical protein JHK82_050670 [Glycine max]|nr:hypothetical protein JHK86_050534 [Glycine max]KAG5091892.1 hypothetical protein JHK82_050670 [Glycine max]
MRGQDGMEVPREICVSIFAALGKCFVVRSVDNQPRSHEKTKSAQSNSEEQLMTPAIKEPLWQRIQNLEAVVTEMANKPNTIPPEKEDILQESLSRIKCIEYDLQKTKKALLATASKQVELAESLESLKEKKRNHGQIVKFQYPTHVARGKYVCRDLLTKLGTSTEAEFLPSSCPDIESLVQLKDAIGFLILQIQSLFLLHEGNQCADVLAKLGANSLSPLDALHDPPVAGRCTEGCLPKAVHVLIGTEFGFRVFRRFAESHRNMRPEKKPWSSLLCNEIIEEILSHLPMKPLI